jgi:hypothetical protein
MFGIEEDWVMMKRLKWLLLKLMDGGVRNVVLLIVKNIGNVVCVMLLNAMMIMIIITVVIITTIMTTDILMMVMMIISQYQ